MFDIAMRFVGMKEVPGVTSNPAILAMLRLDSDWPHDDSVPWCGAFMSYCAWLLRLPRSHDLAARSWLGVGTPVPLEAAQVGFDVVVLQRPSAGPTAGHVGLFAGQDTAGVHLLGGNQNDQVSVQAFPVERVLGVRRVG